MTWSESIEKTHNRPCSRRNRLAKDGVVSTDEIPLLPQGSKLEGLKIKAPLPINLICASSTSSIKLSDSDELDLDLEFFTF